jgi:hypothetical protein
MCVGCNETGKPTEIYMALCIQAELLEFCSSTLLVLFEEKCSPADSGMQLQLNKQLHRENGG